MNSHINIQIQPDAEFPENVLLNKSITKLHKALHDQNQTSIGISFPNYKIKLGNIIRLHGNQADLKTLQGLNWLGGLAGYCEISDIMPVPETVEGYRTVSRIQPTMTLAKLKKRVDYQKARGDLKTEKEVEAYEKQYKARMFAASLDNPYLELQSTSTGEHYRVFIKFGEIKSQPVKGEFNHFGLSKTATIPWF